MFISDLGELYFPFFVLLFAIYLVIRLALSEITLASALGCALGFSYYRHLNLMDYKIHYTLIPYFISNALFL